jgi:hypothetical protein
MRDTHTRPARNFQEQCCPVCGKEFRRNLIGRQKRFCSDACRLEAHRTNKISILTRGEGLQRNDAKDPCGTRNFLVENRGRGSHGIVGPKAVIESEIDRAHDWTVWPSGYAVAQLRKPALVRPTWSGHA